MYLSFTLFFFVDDWVIISEYSAEFRGRTLKWHSRRIWIANLLLAPATVIAAFESFKPIFAALATIAMFVLLIWHTLIYDAHKPAIDTERK